mmetsp:Transcript_111931/g.316640  ORF Transcript_111931/g.316640 Transcript_111931/m.316640 type:complete len:445 (-) Transcript_111931:275-1609(-)
MPRSHKKAETCQHVYVGLVKKLHGPLVSDADSAKTFRQRPQIAGHNDLELVLVLPNHGLHLRIVHKVTVRVKVILRVTQNEPSDDAPESQALAPVLGVDPLPLQMFHILLPAEHRAARCVPHLQPRPEQLGRRGKRHGLAGLGEGKTAARQRLGLNQVRPRVVVDGDRLEYEGREEAANWVAGAQALPHRYHHEVCCLQVDRVEVVHHRHQHRQRGTEAELGLGPTGVARPGDDGFVRAIVPGLGVVAGVHNLDGVPALVEVSIAAVPRKARAHWQARQRIATHHEEAPAVDELRLQTVCPQTVQAEACQRPVAQLVAPLLVHGGVDGAHAVHGVLHGILARLERVEPIRHVQHLCQQLFGPLRHTIQPDRRVGELLLDPKRNLQVQRVVDIALFKPLLWRELAGGHEFRSRCGIIANEEQGLVTQVQNLCVEVRGPAPAPEVG